MTSTWDIFPLSTTTTTTTTSASTTPTISKRRGQKILAANEAQQSSGTQGSDMPFPHTSSPDEDKDSDPEQEQELTAVVEDTKRTVRRKKSSLDLRDVFLHGGESQPPS